jgi:hypothetical protein
MVWWWVVEFGEDREMERSDRHAAGGALGRERSCDNVWRKILKSRDGRTIRAR